MRSNVRPSARRAGVRPRLQMDSDKMDEADSDLSDVTFEQALARLSETVEALEAGELPLSEATRLYERGMRLARICSEMLAAAELKITQIQTAYGEQMRLPPEERAAPGK